MSDILLSSCPCGSQKNYADCCEPLLTGKKTANTPEALMRSRYTAFTVKNVDYLFSSMTPELQQETDREDMQDFADEVDSWVRLEVLNTSTLDADHGNVEFAAYFMYDEQEQRIHENSKFVKQGEQWFYAGHEHQCSSHDHDDEEYNDHQHDDHDHHDHDHHVHDEHCGHNHHHEPYRAEIKIGRNDPCPCGSGKKFKKCCIE
ncbi:MAG: YchJ family protein [Pseudomonadota bacterium]